MKTLNFAGEEEQGGESFRVEAVVGKRIGAIFQ